MKDFTIDSAFVSMLLEGAQAQGVDCTPILLRNQISRLTLSKANSRVPLDAFASLAIELMKILDDEFLGLADKPQPLGSFNMMCRSCISARHVHRSLKRTANYWNLFNNTYHHKLTSNDEITSYHLEEIEDKKDLNNYLVAATLSSIHRFHCWLGGQFIPIKQVCFNHKKPDYSDSYNPLFYGAPIIFNQPECRLDFATKQLNLEVVQSTETLDQYIQGTNLSLIYQPKNYRVISDQVRQWLEKNIKQGNYQATLKQAAQHFKMSQQVLHRRLQAENISFKEIKMQIRRDIAITLLFSNDHKIEEIASLVGFSEPSAFIRAFKSWTGSTPLGYRQQNRS